MRVRIGTALLCVCFVPCHESTVTGYIKAAFQSAAQLNSWTAGGARLRDFVVITESSTAAALENS